MASYDDSILLPQAQLFKVSTVASVTFCSIPLDSIEQSVVVSTGPLEPAHDELGAHNLLWAQIHSRGTRLKMDKRGFLRRKLVDRQRAAIVSNVLAMP